MVINKRITFSPFLLQRDQLADQERKLLSLQRELEQLLEKTGRRSTNKIYHRDFVERESYLQHEVRRGEF